MSNVIIQELICRLRENIGSIYKLSEAISTLDMITSLADVSSSHKYVQPRFAPIMCVKGSRHPILERMDLPREIVANDILATPLEANFHVMTGYVNKQLNF